jgi:SAM-dependent methyltransferase
MNIKRKRFQGVLNILSFNRHFYILGLVALALLIAGYFLYTWPASLFWPTSLLFSYALIMPLIVSAYVYDLSGYYELEWLKNLNLPDAEDRQNININAGFDETSFIIKHLLPKSSLKVFDFYNPSQHTEPAIIRARKVSLVYPNTQQINSNHLPLNDNSVDAIFLLSAAHEIRSHNERIQFLKECHRVCKPNANLILVEHLRDFPNFIAFSIGFTHFFSKKDWQQSFEEAGFSRISETKFTPFMSIFNYRP